MDLIVDEIETFISSKESKKAYDLINNLTIIHPSRREGGIMNCLINELDELIFGEEKIVKSMP